MAAVNDRHGGVKLWWLHCDKCAMLSLALVTFCSQIIPSHFGTKDDVAPWQEFLRLWEAANKTHLVLNSKRGKELHVWEPQLLRDVNKFCVPQREGNVSSFWDHYFKIWCKYKLLSLPFQTIVSFFVCTFLSVFLSFFQSFFLFSSCFPSITLLYTLIFPCLPSVALPLIHNLISTHFIWIQGSDETPYLSTIK